MNNSTQGRLPIPDDARIRPYYDSQKVEQNVATLNFFPALASRKSFRANYVQNPFPGSDTRRVAGISFDLNKQFIINDDANGINARAIVNAIKHAGITVTADQDNTQFLKATIDDHSNFSETEYEGDRAKAYVNGAYVDEKAETAVIKSSSMYELKDPFEIAPNQNFNLKVTFHNASPFPTEAQWTASGQGVLFLKAKLYLAEIES